MDIPKKLMPLMLAMALVFSVALMATPVAFAAGEPQGPPLKIGCLGVMSGHGAAWGLTMKYCCLANARMYNEEGGALIDGVRHKIKVITVDTKQDPKLSVVGAERLLYKEGVKYIIGPNGDNTLATIIPVLEAGGGIAFPYALNKKFFVPPHDRRTE